VHQLRSQARLVQRRSHIHSARTQDGRLAELARCVVSWLAGCARSRATSHTHPHYLETCPVTLWCYKLTVGPFPKGLVAVSDVYEPRVGQPDTLDMCAVR